MIIANGAFLVHVNGAIKRHDSHEGSGGSGDGADVEHDLGANDDGARVEQRERTIGHIPNVDDIYAELTEITRVEMQRERADALE